MEYVTKITTASGAEGELEVFPRKILFGETVFCGIRFTQKSNDTEELYASGLPFCEMARLTVWSPELSGLVWKWEDKAPSRRVPDGNACEADYTQYPRKLSRGDTALFAVSALNLPANHEWEHPLWVAAREKLAREGNAGLRLAVEIEFANRKSDENCVLPSH